MTRRATPSSEPRYLITPSLLNSWLYIGHAGDTVREAASDEVSLEDKRDEAEKRAEEDFLRALRREKTPTTEAQQRGIDYEEATYRGETDASPYVMGGQWQVVGTKELRCSGRRILLYGRLDCLNGGMIYDIKRVSRYSPGKYAWSAQHLAYLTLFPQAQGFAYLAYDGSKLHCEAYWQEGEKTQSEMTATIDGFLHYLEARELMDVFEENWKAKEN